MVGIGCGVLVERASHGFRLLKPRYCSIYDEAFWRHERFWKLSAGGSAGLFNGTPMKAVVLSALGMRVGRRLLDDGCAIPERTLVALGDDCVLNAGSVIQCHSLEDGTFKSEAIVLRDRCTVGTASFVHYGVVMDDDSVLEADAFLMKGSEVVPGSRWLGNPAREVAVSAGPAVATLADEADREPPHAGATGPVGPEPYPRASLAPSAAVRLLDDVRATPDRRPFGPFGPSLSIFSVDSCRRREAELLTYVSGPELTQAQAMRSRERRSTFLMGRALLRLVLTAHRPDVDPLDWPLVRTAAGKVVLQSPGGIDVSLSHTPGAVAVAVSFTSDVGVDLEPLDAVLDLDVVQSFLSSAELATVSADPASDPAGAFLRFWTIKEAAVKSVGAGTAVDFRDVHVSLSPPRVLSDGRDGVLADFDVHTSDDVVDGQVHVLSLVSRRRKRTRPRASRQARRTAPDRFPTS